MKREVNACVQVIRADRVAEPVEDDQHLAGHSDARTTRLYDRRQKQVAQNVVERMPV
jgi:hypothetical protein